MKRLGWAVALGLLAFGVVAGLRPGWDAFAFEVLVLYLGTLLVLALLGRVGGVLPRAGRSAIEQALAVQAEPAERLPALVRMERQVALGVANAGDLHARLRPVLVGIAEPLLAARGASLDRDPARARELLGEDAWELVRPGAEPPAEPFSPGFPERRLTAVVDALERMAR